MSFIEVNFDGLVGPTHNYAGLSLGNIASAANAGAVSRPRAAALQGLAKMRACLDLGLVQGFLPPQPRPDVSWLRSLGFAGDDDGVCAAAWSADPSLLANAISASAMWTANAATVSPSPDTSDGRVHLSIANLSTMPHRSLEPAETLTRLSDAFADRDRFTVHGPVPSAFGDEGAANHMRLCAEHGAPGLEIFVYGEGRPGGFPARQHHAASTAVARRHGLDPDRTCFARQSDAAIEAGAFHNDVVAVANERVLFAHEQAFADKGALFAWIEARLPGAQIVEVAARDVPLEDAVRSYLFNAQLVTAPDGRQVLLAPADCERTPSVLAWLSRTVGAAGPIHEVRFFDLRESMRNGGGPACLRLRVALSPNDLARVRPEYLLDQRKIDALGNVVECWWPDTLSPRDLGHPEFWRQSRAARRALFEAAGIL